MAFLHYSHQRLVPSPLPSPAKARPPVPTALRHAHLPGRILFTLPDCARARPLFWTALGSAHFPGTRSAHPPRPRSVPPTLAAPASSHGLGAAGHGRGAGRGGAGQGGPEEPRSGAGGRSAAELRESWSEFPGVVPCVRPAAPGLLSSLRPSRSIRPFFLPPAAMEQPPASKR